MNLSIYSYTGGLTPTVVLEAAIRGSSLERTSLHLSSYEMGLLIFKQADPHVHISSKLNQITLNEVKVDRMRIGIALEDFPKLLRGIVLEILAQQPDTELLTIDSTGQEQLMTAVATQNLDALIVSDSGRAGRAWDNDLRQSHPRLKLLELHVDGRGAKLSIGQRRLDLNSPSPEDLISALRGADG